MQPLILPFDGARPSLGRDVFVAPGAAVIGRVWLGEQCSVWYAAVLRGDVHEIRLGARCNVQDGAVLHGTLDEFPVVLGEAVSVGHHATVHGAVIEDGALIGIGARVLDGARVGADALIAAGAVVREGMHVPPHHLVVGVPGVVKRELNAREREVVARTPGRYLELARVARLSLAGTAG